MNPLYDLGEWVTPMKLIASILVAFAGGLLLGGLLERKAKGGKER